MNRSTQLLLMGWGVTLSLNAVADVLRCGDELIDEDSTPEEVLQYCGPPSRKETSMVNVEIRQPDGTFRTVGETLEERWYYDRRNNRVRAVITVGNGKIRSIDLRGS